jgi:hypothetical protein
MQQQEPRLDRRERVVGMSAADALKPQAEKSHLALLDKARHRADGLLDRHGRVDPVLVIEIDDLDAEPLQARLADLRDIGRPAVDAVAPPGRRVWPNFVAITISCRRPSTEEDPCPLTTY